jgi:uncharacterized protein YkwD
MQYFKRDPILIGGIEFSKMKRFVPILTALAASFVALAEDSAVSTKSSGNAPPPAVPLFQTHPTGSGLHAESTVYSIGDPTPEEQLNLEMINRARTNPPGEGVLLANTTDPEITADFEGFQVDLSLMQSQFAAIPPAQPLAFSSKLATAARAHSQDMFDHVFQDHPGTDGSTPATRIQGVGFVGSAAENVYSNAKSVAHGHAAFEVDWGGPASNGGMQLPSGHRENIHNPIYREVGIGVVLGFNSAPGKTPLDQVGPQVVTEDFGVAQISTPFITGVAYYDLNGNNFYDAGEGIGNVHVTVAGATAEAFTARSGGYAVPVSGNGSYTVTFSGSGFANVTKTVSVTGSKNQKVDFTPSYSAPVLAGPIVATVNRDNSYTISPIAGATDYQWRSFQKVAAASEGAENDSHRLTVTQTGTYDVFEGIVVKSGKFAFHLITPAESAESARSQYITLSPTYLVNGNASITFQSQLGFASSDQHAQVQVSTDNGANWVAVYNQDGNENNPESSWHLRTVDLSGYTGKSVRVRFAFEFIRGTFFNETDLAVGWLIDDIQFSSVQEIVNEQITAATGNTFQFHPTVVGDFSLQGRAKTGHDFLDWGPAVSVRTTPASSTPELHLNVSALAAGQLQFDITLANGAAPSALAIESRDTLSGTWLTETTNVQTVSGTQFQAVVSPPTGTRMRFYRVRAN